MKKIIVTLVLSLCLLCSAFAATSSLLVEDAGCKEQCPAKNAHGCKLKDCGYIDGSLWCDYPHDCAAENE